MDRDGDLGALDEVGYGGHDVALHFAVRFEHQCFAVAHRVGDVMNACCHAVPDVAVHCALDGLDVGVHRAQNVVHDGLGVVVHCVQDVVHNDLGAVDLDERPAQFLHELGCHVAHFAHVTLCAY